MMNEHTTVSTEEWALDCKRSLGAMTLSRRTLLLGALAWAAKAQSPDMTSSDYVGRDVMPSLVRRQLAALGNRVIDAGRETAILEGTFSDASNNGSGARVIMQIPAKLRFELRGASNRIIVFDGSTSRASSARSEASDEDLIESLVADSADGFFDALRSGASVDLLGSRFRPDPSVEPHYEGPMYDIFELAAKVRTRRDRRQRVKRFYFDADSAMLLRTRYIEESRAVETRFSRWTMIDGSPLPGQIERWENETRIFSFVAASQSLQPRGTDGMFRDPS